MLKGTSTGTASDAAGQYTLEAPGQEAVLVVSYVGYLKKEVPVKNLTVINISLTPDLAQLSEVVVIGYGTQKKSDLTGSVERVDAETFKNQPMTQLTDMLTGTIAGLNANQSATAAGGSSLEIRGRTSLSANTSPMIVLDGVIYNGSLSDINPNDIEAIDILKDASSSAVYGARAASGVIIITTKRGKQGKPTINFSTRLGVSQPTKDRKPLSAEEFLTFRGDYFAEGAINNPSIPKHFYTNPNKLPDNVSLQEWLNYNRNPNADAYTEYLQRLNLYPTEQKNALAGKTEDWYDRVMAKGIRQTYDLSIGGGTEDIRYFWSVGYVNNEGIIRGDKYAAIRSRLNVDFKITDWLSVGANTQFSERDESAVPADLSLMYIASPFGEMYNADGRINLRPHDDPSAYNPLMNYYGQDRERKVNTLFSSLYTNVKLPLGINYKLSFQPRYSFATERNFWGDQTITGTQTFPGGRGTRQNDKTSEWMVDNLLSWHKQFKMHQIDLTFLYNIEKYSSWSELQANQNFSPNPNLSYHGLQFGSNPSLNNTDTKETGDALMGRVNYTLLDKYLFTASLRRDGYSAFGQEQPWAYFPAAAFAWKISDEDFFNENWLVNRLKFRLSWGVNGNRAIGAYSALAQLGSVIDYNGSKIDVGVENTRLSNPGLVWEKTTSINLGVDLGLFKNRLDVSANYYVGTTTDMLMNRILPTITGFRNITTNLGELENRGFELNLRTVNINAKNFNWSSDFVFSLNRNKIKSLFGDQGQYTLLGETRTGELPDFSNQWFPGQAVDVVWDYDVTGIWQIEDKEAAKVYNMSPGDFKAEDVNNDGKYTDLIDKQFIGYTTPRYNLGFRNDFTYKNFTASVFVRGDLGHILPFNQALQGSLSHDRRNYDGGPMPYWTPENRNNDYARLRPIHSAYGGGLGIYKPASFVRIQDISLAYAVPTAVTARLKMNSLSIMGAIRNLYSFDKWPGWDPESGMTPMPQTFTLGLNLSL
ncbi:SusC/RagA family TonB-linked outer membrane protein [Adhaeribacter aerolatus]|uniref:SusC/RagA family TonB-linked outer membrane protein n=2 Tax=Adhaeribacter aerolatus TaxID=670289 RepID=A0A512AYH7_9BACT|nr:SusC/RagA family TonB-linked outer membrane protein [Adhaeribacter aerolatus]